MVLGSSTHFAGWFLAVSVLATAACSQQRTAEEPGAVPELRLEGVRFRLFRGGDLRASGTSDSLTYERGTAAVRAAGLVVNLGEGSEHVLLTAPAADGIVTARTFHATGGLRAIRGEDIAVTESARFDPALGGRGLVVGAEPVELSGRGYRLVGNGFTLDPSVGEIVLRGGTRLIAGLRGAK
jgi:hypothetical protein